MLNKIETIRGYENKTHGTRTTETPQKKLIKLQFGLSGRPQICHEYINILDNVDCKQCKRARHMIKATWRCARVQ